jgi:predicted ester cyclase
MAVEQQHQYKDLVLREYDEVWNKGNYDYADEVVHPEFTDHPPTRFFDIGRTGPAALKEAGESFRNAFPDFHDTPELVVAEGDMVAYLGMISGTQEGELFGFPASGRKMRVWGVNFFRMRDGLLGERWGQFDVLTMMQQLGLAPGPPQDVDDATPEFGDPHRAAEAPDADIEANKAVYRRMVGEIVNQGKFEVVDEIFHPDYVDHTAPPGAPGGLEGVKAIFGMFRTGFPDVKFTIDEMVGEGNYVATLVHGEGTQTGQFIEFPPSGKFARWRSVGFFRIEDGQIREHWGVPDLLGLLIQIGIIPPPGAESAAGTLEDQVRA